MWGKPTNSDVPGWGFAAGIGKRLGVLYPDYSAMERSRKQDPNCMGTGSMLYYPEGRGREQTRLCQHRARALCGRPATQPHRCLKI